MEFMQENPQIAARKIGARFGVSRRWMEARKKELMSKQPGNGKLTGAVDASEFIAKFDVPKRITDSLPKLAGKVISDNDFRASLGIDNQRWARARDRDEFEEYQIEIRSKVYWGMPETLAVLRGKLDVV